MDVELEDREMGDGGDAGIERWRDRKMRGDGDQVERCRDVANQFFMLIKYSEV